MRYGWVVGLLAVVAGVIALGVAVIALVTRDDDTLVLDLEAGQCFEVPDDLSGGRIERVRTIDCDEPHGAEVFATGELNRDRDLPYPSDEQALFARVDRACAAALAQRAGASERFGVLPVVPDEKSWEPFRGRYVCVAIPYGGGTVEGSIGSATV